MSPISRLVSLSILVASSIGCRPEPPPSGDGRLDVVIRPDSAAASGRRVEGSFVLHDQDGRTVDRLAVVELYDTLSVALPQGAYSLEWQPELSFTSAEDVDALARSAAGDTAAPVVIAAGRVTTVNVRATLAPNREREMFAQDEELPSIEIRIARH